MAINFVLLVVGSDAEIGSVETTRDAILGLFIVGCKLDSGLSGEVDVIGLVSRTLPTIGVCGVTSPLAAVGGAGISLGLLAGATSCTEAGPLTEGSSRETAGTDIICPHLQRDRLPDNSLATS